MQQCSATFALKNEVCYYWHHLDKDLQVELLLLSPWQLLKFLQLLGLLVRMMTVHSDYGGSMLAAIALGWCG